MSDRFELQKTGSPDGGFGPGADMRRFFREYTKVWLSPSIVTLPHFSQTAMAPSVLPGTTMGWGAGSGPALKGDSFECAINMLAPACAHCGTKIIGHGLEAGGSFYCCDHCAERAGVKGLRDRV